MESASEPENLNKPIGQNQGQAQTQSDSREKGPQGRYVKLENRLGSGAYKDVWRAYDTNEGN